MRNQIISMMAATLLGIGCGTSRELSAYRNDTQKLLDTRSTSIKGCYDDALKSDRNAAGTVTIQFVVQKDTGAITQAAVDASRSTAPPVLHQCVLHAVEGLKLEPADSNEGRATFVYEFKPASG